MTDDITALDARLLRAAIQVAQRSVDAGNHPFGAILADQNGQILLEAQNTVVTDGDPTGHAETNLVRLTVQLEQPRSLTSATLYTSAEPCPMCSGAIYWGDIGRVVYGLSQERLYSIVAGAGGEEAWIVHCRELLSRGWRTIEVVGPALEDEAAAAHEAFWHPSMFGEG